MGVKKNSANKDEVLNIAFCVNNAYVNHLIVTIYSLFKNNPYSKLHIHILSSDVSENSRAAILSLMDLHTSSKVSFHNIDKNIFSKMKMTMNYISVETYYRLILSEVLSGIDKVLYLDADILVIDEVKAMFELKDSQSLAAAVPDIYISDDVDHKKTVGLGSNDPYTNAGVMLYNLEAIRKEGISKELLKVAASKAHLYQDQDAINIVLKGRVEVKPRQYNYQIKDKVYNKLPSDDMTILHYSGSMKPWNRDRVYDAFSIVYDQYKLEASRHVNEHSKNIKFGLLKYSTDNVGDNIQGIAARRFLPRVDYYFERDNIDATKTNPGEVVKLIINGWWGDGPENWPPLNQNLDILPISMYVEDRIQDEFEKPRSKQLLNFIGPIGARSRGTKDFLEGIGVNSYFSGCLTLTLNPDKSVKKQDYILAVDVSDEVYAVMRSQTKRRIIRMDVMRNITDDVNQQYRLAEYYLYLYQSAHSVVTTRLHTMLPCIALGTPVLFINDILNQDDVRFSGLSDLSFSMSSADYTAKPAKYKIDTPPANKDKYYTIRRDLERACARFTGYDGKSSYLSSSVEDLLQDSSVQQAFLSGLAELGPLRKLVSRSETALLHKTNHVNELSAEVEKLKSEIDDIKDSRAWRIANSIKTIKKSFKK